eukprot:scaffold74184_cov69-Phaeocystis_antarctica.AAC.2
MGREFYLLWQVQNTKDELLKLPWPRDTVHNVPIFISSLSRRASTCKRVELRSCATPTRARGAVTLSWSRDSREEYAVITISIFRFPPSCSTGRLSSSGSAA